MMKTKILLSFLILLSLSISGFSKTWTVTNSGATFSPDSITISNGDSVLFTIASAHNASEVSQATWQANGNTHLSNGFETPFGGGLVLPAQLTPGTHYYVCTPHAAIGMKGVIVVQNATTIASKSLSEASIFPNPASEMVKIKSKSVGSTFVVSDLTGKQVLKGVLESEETFVNINQLAQGVYFMQIGNNSGQTFKLIKK